MKIYRLIYSMLILLSSCARYHTPDSKVETSPRLFPDYTDTTFPQNIAPPNFRIEESGEAYQIEIGLSGEPQAAIVMQSKEPKAIIPERKWKSLLEKAVGDKIYIRITILREGKWVQYAEVEDSISPQRIDPYLVYRLLYPGYELWNEIGIYQRDLTSYKQTTVLDNRDFGKQCVNCHTFANNSPDRMMVHIRGKQGGTLIYADDKPEKVKPNPSHFKHGATYPAWHPSGRYIAFSANEIQQFFHATGKKPIEVSDLASDLMIYDVQQHRSFTDSLVYGDRYMETFPTWSPDGKTLYFCRARAWQQGVPLDSVRYDLYRIQFDPKTEQLHTLECVYEASAEKKSVSFPRISPNGKFLMFTLSDYGNFSIWHPESDLHLLELSNGSIRKLAAVNSDDVESFHTWSSNGYWFVFSSKRMDGLWARPFFAAFNPETGQTTKPFLLPQKDPDFYDTFTYTFNLPELITKPITNQRDLLKTIEQTAVQATERE
ncbi:cytochrome C biosynthesis protein [Bacteroides sp. AN502(2024)]|uniref:TolB family protein n=1 Tax=Bacteroides sp. AN502(2024) TaxID=3160599 RepID=UPI003514517A